MSRNGATAPEVSVVMPCLNEEAAIGSTIGFVLPETAARPRPEGR